ncbi:TetR/AcrR family transcriptional regulator [Methylococcus sp. EFPC2]|uniref:TetR/AcrR family transcriptional regulator n=1 Tax=Methylococcus sp. EFPC2 TaxID=2812648 RepID=UPI001967081D|nr:TetR family transcriptional regulator [Methylococcus sp. EFPC2]QSA95613.1 TetR family transcriptional regulator [Methylococcus sp. EFPC2]
MPQLNTRERLLEAACRLFYRDGVHATSIEVILDEAGVARQSLYQHFQSKDGLVGEFLKRRDQHWRGWLEGFVESRAETPRERLLALFDFLQDWFSQPDFHGCAFINIAAEFADPQHPFRQIAADHKCLVLDYIRTLCRQAELNDPEVAVRRLGLLMEGAITTELVTPGSNIAAEARCLAALVLDAHT